MVLKTDVLVGRFINTTRTITIFPATPCTWLRECAGGGLSFNLGIIAWPFCQRIKPGIGWKESYQISKGIIN